MRDTTALEGLFEEVRCSVEKLDCRVVGIEQRVHRLSTDIEQEQKEFNSFRVIMDFKQFLFVMLILVIATAIIMFYLMVHMGG
jgi:uncharacterized protein YaaN involved in tellurite resistance